jgi:hypothetical protein
MRLLTGRDSWPQRAGFHKGDYGVPRKQGDNAVLGEACTNVDLQDVFHNQRFTVSGHPII